jgi:hypothetical protein
MRMSSLRVLAAAVVLLGATTGAAAADEPARPRWTVTTNPVRMAILHVQVDVERVVAPRWSVFLAPIGFFHATWYPFAHAEGTTARGGGADFGARYWFGPAPTGVFVSPYFSLYRGEVFKDDVKTLDGWVFSLGGQAGYQLLLGRWALSAGGGLSYGLASEEAPPGSVKAEQLPHRGVWLNVRLNVGFGF